MTVLKKGIQLKKTGILKTSIFYHQHNMTNVNEVYTSTIFKTDKTEITTQTVTTKYNDTSTH